ncbi:hypothetical protein GF342_01480 [Candidatus Woesearchaeota archaeon]|nr:hypothetical protein [Candidatus Woesearchaeota archaeon]
MLDSDTLDSLIAELEVLDSPSQLLNEDSVEDVVQEGVSHPEEPELDVVEQLLVTHYESSMPEELLYEQTSHDVKPYRAGYDLEDPEETLRSPEVRQSKIEEHVQQDIRLVKIHSSAGLRYERNWSSIHEKEAAQWSGIVNSTYNMFLYDIS